MIGILGKKIGTMQIFTEDGSLVLATAIEAGPCPVLAIRGKSVQLGFGAIKNESRLKRPIAGIFKKLNIAPRKFIREVVRDMSKEYKIGEEIKVDLFKMGDFVDVTGDLYRQGFSGRNETLELESRAG